MNEVEAENEKELLNPPSLLSSIENASYSFDFNFGAGKTNAKINIKCGIF